MPFQVVVRTARKVLLFRFAVEVVAFVVLGRGRSLAWSCFAMEVQIRCQELARRIRRHNLHTLGQEAARASDRHKSAMDGARGPDLFRHSSVAARSYLDCPGSPSFAVGAFEIRH